MSEKLSRKKGKSNSRFIIKWVGAIITVAIAVMAIIVAKAAMDIKVVPGRYILFGCGLYVVGALVVLGVTLFSKRTWFNIISVIIFVLLVIVSVFLYKQITLTRSTLEKNAGIKVETSSISVYVKEEDAAKTISDAKNYTFGILRTLDRENTDETIAKINDEIGTQISVSEYEEITDLADAMMDGEVQIIILNDSYYNVLLEWNSLLEECEIPVESRDYETFAKNLRKLGQYQVKKEIEESSSDEYLNEQESEVPYKYVDTDCFIMYISGQDAWGGVSGTSRSDVNILAVVNNKTHQVLLVSTPRDYYLPLSVSNGVKDKLTHAGIYGVDCSRDTLEMLYGYNIDYYFKLNFSGFEAIIDALGGVTVWSEYDFTVEPIKHYVVGDNYLTGLEALAFARERHAIPGGDNDRGRNQMNVIVSVVDKLTSSALLENYSAVLKSLNGMYITDMPYDVVASLIRDQIDDGSGWNIKTYAVTGTGTSGPTYSMGATQLYVMEPNMDSVEEAKRLIQETLDGK